MSKPALRAVDNQQVRDVAHQPEWRSDAERERLPVVNVVDTGAPLLRPDEVLGHAGHDARIGRK
jgi:hypothetical protein